MYFGTFDGIFVLNDGETIPSQFNQVIGRISLMVAYNNELYLAGENDIVYHLKDNEVNIIRLRNNEIKGIKNFYFDEKK